ncbi:hypothetical protein [Trichormus sp. NMC-1]|uniref:hypothetical protein n=1 Tax=Trichormus sp. NMC-1 TaxID=1853259 RepID=UPI000B06E65E|nr:hypothetical protein [Trichormus sp. NMC-1]
MVVALQQNSGVRSQESGVKLALCIGLNLDFVPPNYANCCRYLKRLEIIAFYCFRCVSKYSCLIENSYLATYCSRMLTTAYKLSTPEILEDRKNPKLHDLHEDV